MPMRFQQAARDGRAIVYAQIQAEPVVARAAELLATASMGELVLARAVMNGESSDAATWRRMFPTLFAMTVAEPRRIRSEMVLAVSLEVAERGDQVRNQLRGAIVEALAGLLLCAAVPAAAVRRERRVLFDGVPAEIHPYDVTVEIPGAAEAWDCKWSARGIGEDVLHQLDDARRHAADEDERLAVGLVVLDADRSCRARLEGLRAPSAEISLVTMGTLAQLAAPRTR